MSQWGQELEQPTGQWELLALMQNQTRARLGESKKTGVFQVFFVSGYLEIIMNAQDDFERRVRQVYYSNNKSELLSWEF